MVKRKPSRALPAKLRIYLAPRSKYIDNPLDEWKLVGGNTGLRRIEYIQKHRDPSNGKCTVPATITRCPACQNRIKDNCYLRNEHSNELIIIGTCCLLEFTTRRLNKLKRCIICYKPHRNKSDKWCNSCRGGLAGNGQYKGRSYRWIVEHDPDYCRRVLYVGERNDSLRGLISWLHTNRHVYDASMHRERLAARKRMLRMRKISKMTS